MRRPHRYCPAGFPVHIIQRGNNRTDCFRSDYDMAAYINRLRDASQKYQIDIHAWVLMPNHVHLLVTPICDSGVSRMMQSLGRHYVRDFNRRHGRSGTLWEGRFRSSLVQAEDYFMICQRYIELNPVRAGLVSDPAKYHWSSHRTNAYGEKSSICKPHEVYLALGRTEDSRLSAYRSLFMEHIRQRNIETIRYAANKGLVFGSDRFKDEIENRSGQRTRLLKRGPKSVAQA